MMPSVPSQRPSCCLKRTMHVVTVLCLTMAAGAPTASAQTTLWENRGQPEFSGSALETEDAWSVIVAVGLVGDQFHAQWFVRGLDRRSGETMWEDRFGPVTFGFAKDVA